MPNDAPVSVSDVAPTPVAVPVKTVPRRMKLSAYSDVASVSMSKRSESRMRSVAEATAVVSPTKPIAPIAFSRLRWRTASPVGTYDNLAPSVNGV